MGQAFNILAPSSPEAPMPDLSASQEALLAFLRRYIAEHGYPPSYREMAAALDFRSINGIAYQLRCLEEKGYLERAANGAPARAIRLRGPAGATGSAGTVQVPVLGQVAAGQPSAAEALPDEVLRLDAALCPGRDVFALRVSGDSMVEAGIFEGDLVFVQRRAQVTDGDVVVALLDGETTVKTFRRRKGAVWLEPANRRLKPILVPREAESSIAGVVVGVYRRLC
jgi:repressor LexA